MPVRLGIATSPAAHAHTASHGRCGRRWPTPRGTAHARLRRMRGPGDRGVALTRAWERRGTRATSGTSATQTGRGRRPGRGPTGGGSRRSGSRGRSATRWSTTSRPPAARNRTGGSSGGGSSRWRAPTAGATTVEALSRIKGVDTLTAFRLTAEAGSFSRFRSAPAFASRCGLTPSEHSSGESERRGGITGAGNALARTALIESAWHYSTCSPRPKAPAPGTDVWIGNTYLDDPGRDSPASLNSTGDM